MAVTEEDINNDLVCKIKPSTFVASASPGTPDNTFNDAYSM